MGRRQACLLSLAVITAASLAAPAAAQTARRHVEINGKRPADALIDLGLQTGSTIGGPVLCQGAPVTLRGDFTLGEALDRILANTNCAYQLVDGRTARIRAASRRRQAAAPPRPAPAAPATPPLAPEAPAPPVITDVAAIEVAAAKRPDYAGDLPGAVTVLRASRLSDTGVVDTEGLARQSAAFTTTNLGPARNKILMRGLSDGAFTGRTQSTVGTYLDDIPVTYNAPDPDLRLVDVEGVEILRGPQGALYGGGSLSGVYRIVTRRPDLEGHSASVTLLGAVTTGGAGSSQIDAVANYAIAPGKLALRLAAYDDRQGGYLQDDVLRLSNVDLTERSGGRASLLWRINDRWDVTLSGAAQTLNSADTQYVTSPMRRANQVREAHHNSFSEGAVSTRGTGDWGSARATIAYVHHDYNSRYDATSVVTAFGGPGDSIGVFDEGTANRMIVADAYWSSPEGRRWHFMLGGFASNASEGLPSELQARTGQQTRPPVLLYAEDRRDARIETALYGEAAYNADGGWSFVAGARAFDSRIKTWSDIIAPATRRSTRGEARYQSLSPKLSVQKVWSPGRSAYALWSSGYRAGGFNTAGINSPTSTRARFSPDRLQNFEIGGHYTRPDQRLRVDAALFYVYWSRLQTDQYLPFGLSYTANVGTGANLGLEGEISYQAGRRWLVQANALVNNPTITKLDPGFQGVVGARLPGVPKVAVSSLVTYQTELASGRALIVTGEAAYTGGSRLTFDPRYAPSTSGYYTANLSVQLAGEKTRWALLVSNPFNAAKDTFSYGNPFSFGQVRQATPQRPRTVSLRLSRDW